MLCKEFCQVYCAVLFGQYIMLYKALLSGMLCCVMPFLSGIPCFVVPSCPVYCAVQCLFVRYIVQCNAFLVPFNVLYKALVHVLCRMQRFCAVY